MWGHLCS